MNELFQANENPTLKNEYTPPAEISSELMIEDAYKKVQAFENYVDEHRKLNLTQTQNENKNVLDPNSENFVIDLFNKLETPSVSTNLANPSIFGYDPNRQTADTRFINDWEESLTGTATSMWRTLRNAMTDMSKNTLLGDYMLKTDTFGLTKGISLQSEYNTYLEKVGKIQDDYNNGLIDEENYQSKVKLIQDQYSDVLSEREKLLNEVQSYDDEIASRKINKKYTLTQSALEGDLDAGFIDKFTYQLPNLIGSSIGLMLPQALVTFTTNLARTQVVAGLSAATGAGAVATPVIEVAGTVVSALAAVGTLLHFRKQESLAELGGSYLNQMEKFKSDYLAKNPQLNFDESKIPFTALAEMEKKAVRGAEEVFKGNMLLATSDILQALLLPGSSLLKMVKTSSNIGRTLKTLDNINDVAKPSLFNSITSKAAGLSKSFKDPVMYNKLFNSSVKPIATAGTALWVKGMLPEGFEEGYQYALGKRAEELAEMTEEQYNALGDNKIDLLGEAYDVATSLELNPTSFIAQTLGLGKIGSTTLGGKYVGDKEFEFSAHGGMLLAGMMGGISTGIKTTKDIAALTKYKKELVKIGAINEVGERVKSLHSNIGKALVNGRTEELKTAIRSLSSSYNNEEIKNYITKEEGEEYISKIEQLEEKYQRYSDRINSIPRDKFLSMGGSIDFKKGKQKVILDLMLAEDTIEESNKGLKELSIESRQVLRDEIQKVLPNEYSHLLDLLVDLKTNQLSEIALNTMDIAKGKFDAKGLNKTSRFFGKNFEEFSKSKKSSFSRIGEIRNQLKEMIADTVSVNENLAELNIDEILNIEDSSLFNNIIEEISLEANIYGNIQDFKKLSNIKSSKDILDYYTNLPEVKEEKIKEEKEKANKKEEEKSAEAAKVKAEKEEKKKKEEGKKEEKVEQEFDDITEEDESDIINSGLNENNARAERESSTFNSEEYLGELFENFPNKRIVDLNSLLDKKEELEALSGEEITAIIDSRNNLIEELINTYEPSSEAKKNSLIRAVNKIIDEFVEVRKNLHPEFSEEKDFEVENNVDLSDELDEEFEIEHYSQGEKETFNKTDKSHHVMTQAYKANKVTYTYNIPLFLVDSGAIQPNDDVKLFKGKWTNPETLETFEGYLFQMASGPLKGVDIAFMPEIERPKYTINNIETIAKIYKLIDEAKPGSFVYTKVSKIFDGPAFINKTDKGGAESVSIDKVYQLNMNDPSNNQVDKRIHFTSIKNEGRVGAVSLSFIPEELKGKKIVTAFNKLPAKGTPIALVPKMVNGEEKYMAIPLQRRNFSEFKEEFDKLLDNQSKLDSFYGKVVSKLSSLVKESKDSSGNTNFLKTYFKVNERKFTISDQDTAINVLTSIKNDPKIGINIYFIQTNTGINKIVKINSLIDAETGVVESKYILSKKFELEKEGKTINVKSVLIGSVLDHNGLHFTLVGDDVIHAPSSLNTTQENIIEGYEEAVGVKPTTLPEAFGIIDSLKTDVNVKHLSSLEKGMENKEDKTLLYNEARKNIIQFGLFKTYAVRTTGKVSKDGPVNTDQQYYNALIQSPAYKKLSDEQKEYGKFQYYGASYSTIGLPASISEYKVMSEAEFKASENKTLPTESKDESSKESDNAPKKTAAKKTPSKKTTAKKTSTEENVEQDGNKQPEEETISLIQELEKFEIEEDTIVTSETYNLNNSDYVRVTRAYEEDLNKVKKEKSEDVSSEKWKDLSMTLNVANQGAIGDANDIINRTLMSKLLTFNSEGEGSLTPLVNAANIINEITRAVQDKLGKEVRDKLFFDNKSGDKLKTIIELNVSYLGKQIEAMNKVVASKEFIDKYGKINGLTTKEILLRNAGPTGRKIAGTSDILFTTDGGYIMPSDFKITSNIDLETAEKFTYQLSYYGVLLKTMGFDKITDEAFIFHTPYTSETRDDDDLITRVFGEDKDEITQDDYQKVAEAYRRGEYLDLIKPVIGLNTKDKDLIIRLDLKANDNDFINMVLQPEVSSKVETFNSSITPVEIKLKENPKEKNLNLESEDGKEKRSRKGSGKGKGSINPEGFLIAFQNNKSSEEIRNDKDEVMVLTNTEKFDLTQGFLDIAADIIFKNSETGSLTYLNEIREYGIEVLKDLYDSYADALDELNTIEKPTKEELNRITRLKNLKDKIDFILTEQTNPKTGETYYPNVDPLMREVKRHLKAYSIKIEDDTFSYEDTERNDPSFDDTTIEEDFISKIHQDVKIIMSLTPDYHLDRGEWKRKSNRFGLYTKANFNNVYLAIKSAMTKRYDSSEAGMNELIDDLHNSNNPIVSSFAEMLKNIGDPVKNNQIKKAFFKSFATYNQSAVLSVDEYTTDKEGNTTFKATQRNAKNLSRITSAETFLVQMIEQEAFIGEEGDKKSRTITKKSGEEIPLFYEDYNFETNSNEVHYGVFALTELSDKIKDIIGSISERSKSFLGKSTEEANNNSGRKSLYLEIYRNNLLENGLEEHKISKDLLEEYENDEEAVTIALEKLIEEELAFNNQAQLEAYNVFKDLGFNVTPQSFLNYLEKGGLSSKQGVAPQVKFGALLENNLSSLISALINEANGRTTPVSSLATATKSRLRTIASAVVDELSMTAVGNAMVGDKTRSPHVRYSFINGIFATMEQALEEGNIELIKSLYKGKFASNPAFIDHFTSAIAGDKSDMPVMSYNFGNTVKGTNEYVDIKDFTEIDFLRNMFLKHQNAQGKPSYFSDTLSDKSVMLVYSTMRNKLNPFKGSLNGDNLTMSQSDLALFQRYVVSEYESIIEAEKESGLRTTTEGLTKNNKISGYHTHKNSEDSITLGLGHKFVLFPYLNPEILAVNPLNIKGADRLLSKMYNKNKDGSYSIKPKDKFNIEDGEVKSLISNIINKSVVQSAKDLKKRLIDFKVLVEEVDVVNNVEVRNYDKLSSILFSEGYVGHSSNDGDTKHTVLTYDVIKELMYEEFDGAEESVRNDLHNQIFNFIKTKNINSFKNLEVREKIIDFAILDFTLGYEIKSIELLKLTGHPAMMAKEVTLGTKVENGQSQYERFLSDDNYKAKVLTEMIAGMANNLSKRNASLMAAGNLGAWKNREYRLAIADDIKVNSKHLRQYIDELKSRGFLTEKDITDSYEGADIADAQEFVTVFEHLSFMESFSYINEDEFKGALFIHDIEEYYKHYTKEPTQDQIKLGEKVVFSAEKPVQRIKLDQEDVNNPRELYVKSSSYTLFPLMVKGTPFEDVLKGMKKNRVDRLVFKSGVKHGLGLKGTNQLFIGDGTAEDNFMLNPDFFVDSNNPSDEHNILTLDRNNFFLQLEVPYESDKSTVTTSSQQKRMTFLNLANNLEVLFDLEGGKPKVETIGKLKNRFFDSYKRIHEAEMSKLKKELDIDDKGQIRNLQLFSKIITEEAKSSAKNFSPNTIEGLKVIKGRDGKFEYQIPLGFSLNTKDIEPVITSLIEKRIAKYKMPGFSKVQGSEIWATGDTKRKGKFKSDETLGELRLNEENLYNQIVWTSKEYVGKTKLNHTHKNDRGQVEMTEALTSQYLNDGNNKIDLLTKDENGEFLFLDNEAFKEDGSYVIDKTKIDPSILEINGFRIPYQGFNSGAAIKIVGFLPKAMGDLIIVPGEIAGQMGSDYDVDKIYAYNYNYYYTFKNGKPYVKRVNSSTTLADLNRSKNILAAAIREEMERVIIFSEETDKDEYFYSLFPELNEDNKNLSDEAIASEVDSLDYIASNNRRRILGNLGIKAKAIKTFTADDLTIKKAQNEIIAIHMSIYTTPEIFGDVINPNSMAIIKETNEYFDELVGANNNDINYAGLVLTGVQSPAHQFDLYFSNKSGKTGVAIASLAATGHSMAQLSNLYFEDTALYVRDASGHIINEKFDVEDNLLMDNKSAESIYSGRIVEEEVDGKTVRRMSGGLWRADKVYTIKDLKRSVFDADGKVSYVKLNRYLISDVITHIQSMAVDNAKEQLLALYGLNDQNFSLGMAIVRMGIHPYLAKVFLKQPAVLETYSRLARLDSIYENSFTPDKFKTIVSEVKDEIIEKLETIRPFNKEELEKLEKNPLEFHKLEKALYDGFNLTMAPSEEFLISQYATLVNLEKFNNMSDIFGTLSKITNIDSKGLGGSVQAVVRKNEDLQEALGLKENSKQIIGNVEKLINKTASGILAQIPKTVLDLLSSRKNPLFFHNAPVVEEILTAIKTYVGRENLTDQQRNDIIEGIRNSAYVTFAKEHLLKVNQTISGERLRLLTHLNAGNRITGQKNLPLYERIVKARGKISNYLLNSIHSPNMNDNNKVFKHLAIISSQDPLHKDNVIRAWEDLLNDSDESMREIAKDLILYSMIVSPRSFGAFNMLEYVPNNYLNKLGFSKFLRTLNREMFNISWNSSSSMYNIVKNLPDQIIQHNIGMVKTVREVVEGSELYDNVSYVDQNGRVKTKSNVLVEFELINPSSNDAKYNRQAKNLIYQFKYKDNLGSDKVVDLYPTYLSKYDPKTKEKNLYKADSISENTGNVIYKIVDKAGLTQFVEYDLSSNYVNSFVNGNKATGNDLGSNSQEVINFILSSSLNYYRSNKDSKLADLDTELADMDILINQIRNNSDGLGQDGPGLPLGETLNYIERYLFEQIGIVSNTQSKGVSKDSKLADLKRLHALIRAINTETPEMFNGIVIKDLQTRINSVSGNFDGSTIRLNISQFNKDDNPFEMSKDLALIRVLLHEVGEIIPMKTKDEEFLKTLNPERVKQINEANARLDEIYDEYVNHVRNNLDPFETMSAELLRAMETSLKFSKIPSAARDIQTLSDLSNQLSSYHEFSDGGKKLLDKIVDAYFDNNVHILKSDENVETVRRFLVESVLPDIQYVQDEYYAYANKDEFIPELMSNDSLREQLFLIPSKYNGLQRAFQALVDLFMGLFGGKSEYNDTLLEDALDSLFTITGAVQFGDGQLDEMYKTVIREDPNLDITLIKERRNNILLSQTEIAEEEIIDPVKSYKFELDTNDDFLSNRVINTEFILEEYQKNTITNVIDKIVNDFDKPMVINAKANSGKTTMLTLIDKYFKSSDDVSTVLASTSLVGSAKLQLESRKYNNKGVVNLKNYFNKNGQLEELRLIRSLMDHNEGSKIVLLIDNGEDLTPNEIEQLQKLQTENWSEYEETKNVDLNIVIAADPDGYTPIFIGQKGVKGYVQNTNNNLKNAPAVYGFENVTNYTETKSLTFGELISPIKKLRANEDVDFDTIITEFNTDAVGDEKSNMESVEQVISEEEMSKMKNSPKQIDQLFRKFNVPYSIMTRTLSEANRINDMMADFYRTEENYAPYQASSEIIFTKDISDKRNRNKSILPGIIYKVDKVTYETISFQDSKGNVHEGYTFKANMKSDVINDIGVKNSNFSKINNVNVILFPTENAHYDYIGEFNISSQIKRFKSKGVLLNEFKVMSSENKQFLKKLDTEIEKLTKDKETEGSLRVYQLKTLRNSLVSPVIGKDRTDYNAYTFYAGDRKTIKTNQKSNIIGLYDKNESEKSGVNILEREGNIRSNYKQFALDLLNAEPLKIFMIKQGEKVVETKEEKPVKTSNEKQIEITSSNYTKETPVNNPDVGFIFTENSEMLGSNKNVKQTQALIRTDKNGNINPNALPIVTKKYQVAGEKGQWKDTDEDFNSFKEINSKLIDNIKNSSYSKLVFPVGFATDKAKLPTRFAEWLKDELLSNFGLVTELNETKSGLNVISVEGQKTPDEKKVAPKKKTTIKPKPDLNEGVGFTRKHLGYSADLIEYILEDMDLDDLSYSDTFTDQEKQDFTNKVKPRIVRAIKEKITNKKEFNVENKDGTLNEQLGIIVSSKDFITMVRNILAYIANTGGTKFTGNLEGRYLDVSKAANEALYLESSIELILKSFLNNTLDDIKNKINRKASTGEHINYFSEIEKQLRDICR